MFEKITSLPKNAHEHVVRCRGRYAATAGFITGAVVMRTVDDAALSRAVEFMQEKGIWNEFANLTDEI